MARPVADYRCELLGHVLSGDVTYRYGPRRVKLRVGDSLLFDATAMHGIEDIGTLPVSYLCVVFTLRS